MAEVKLRYLVPGHPLVEKLAKAWNENHLLIVNNSFFIRIGITGYSLNQNQSASDPIVAYDLGVDTFKTMCNDAGIAFDMVSIMVPETRHSGAILLCKSAEDVALIPLIFKFVIHFKSPFSNITSFYDLLDLEVQIDE